MGSLFLLAVAAVPVILTVLAIVYPSNNLLWGHHIARVVLGGQGPYRDHKRLDVRDNREPRSVRAAAILTALLGGMIVPGGLAAIAGGIVVVAMLSKGAMFDSAENATIFLVGLSAPSGVIIALRCLRLYGPMLDNQQDVTARMRSLAVHSGLHNALLLLVYAGYGLSENAEREQLLWATYPLVSLFHAGLLAVAARAIERCRRETEEADEALGAPAAWTGAPLPEASAVVESASVAMR